MSTKPIFAKSANSGSEGTESPDFIVAKSKDLDTYIPPIDFSTASNFVRFGSGEEYYAESIKRIYNDYPYDGSAKEKTNFYLSSSYLDKWMIDNKYPRYSGYAAFDGTSYLQVNRGYQEATVPSSTKLSTLFGSKKVIQDTTKRRKQTAYFDFDDGVTWEWRMKIDGFNGSYSGSYLYKFSSDVGFINVALIHQDHPVSPTGQSVFNLNMSSSAGWFGATISNDNTVTTSSIADGSWHHYAISLFRLGSDLVCDFYFDGKINKRKAITAATFPNLTSSVTSFIMSGSWSVGATPYGSGPSIDFGG